MAILGVIGRLIGATVTRELIENEEASLEDVTVPVSSSCIRTISWRGADQIITVEFIRGGSYDYEGSHELFLAFIAASSKGEFFNSHFA